jgi:hypothetical protein
MTEAQRAALKWLREHGGNGIFGTRGGVLLAGGEWAPFMRSTWNALERTALVQKRGKRLFVTTEGAQIDCGKTAPRVPVDFLGGRDEP